MKQKLSDEGVHAIKRFAILNFRAHRDPHGWVIGFSHRDRREPGKRIYPDMEVTEAQAEALFREDIQNAERYVRECITREITQNQFDALCMFVFFLPDRSVFPDCDIVRHVNEGNFDEAGVAMLMDLDSNRDYYEAIARRRWVELKMFAKDA